MISIGVIFGVWGNGFGWDLEKSASFCAGVAFCVLASGVPVGGMFVDVLCLVVEPMGEEKVWRCLATGLSPFGEVAFLGMGLRPLFFFLFVLLQMGVSTE
jgi:hypothetical protein